MLKAFLLFLAERFVLLFGKVGVVLDIFNKIAAGLNVALAVKQDTVRVAAVAPGSARLLIIALKIFRHVVMDNKADVRLVYTHTKRVRSNHNPLAVVDEIVLIFDSLRILQSRVIARRGNTARVEHIADVLDLLSG